MIEYQFKIIPTKLYEIWKKPKNHSSEKASRGVCRGVCIASLNLNYICFFSCIRVINKFLSYSDPKFSITNIESKTTYLLNIDSTIALTLLFKTLDPFSFNSTIKKISTGIEEMSKEERQYWYHKSETNSNAIRALQILLEGVSPKFKKPPSKSINNRKHQLTS